MSKDIGNWDEDTITMAVEAGRDARDCGIGLAQGCMAYTQESKCHS
jgi:3-hydroxy-3-methylglutaryl CoA synthase